MEEFENTNPPIVLDYSRAKPLGYRAVQKLTRFFPLTALPNTDIVRFVINSNGYWDPYSSYLRFTVQIKNMDSTAPLYKNTNVNRVQLDNSASSLIQTMSFVQNGVEIERIDRYEVLASIMHDMFYSQEQRNQRLHEGFGVGMPEVASCSDSIMSELAVANTSSTKNTGNSSIAFTDSYPANGLPKLEAKSGHLIPSAGVQVDSGHLDFPHVYFDGSNEPVMAGTTAASDTITKLTFCVPILSGIFGVLMPADEIKYIPMIFFPNLEMNFRLNPYAFFSNCPKTTYGRNFEVTSCELFVNMIYFPPAVNSALSSLVKNKGLYLHTCSYYYGPSHVVPASSTMETYPINMSFKSLRSILWCFIPSNYRLYPYIRELRRKALSLTSAQTRVGGDLFPTFPIGNLGELSTSGKPQTNADFLVNLYKSFGRLHDTVNDSLINSHNFCCGNNMLLAHYNTDFTDTNAFCYPEMVRGYALQRGGTTYALYDKGVKNTAGNTNELTLKMTTNGCDLANQIVPRAAYGIDLDTITSDDSVISGVNTLINKPFELLLEGRNDTTESCELNIFLYYDFVVMVDTDFTVKYLGRGG